MFFEMAGVAGSYQSSLSCHFLPTGPPFINTLLEGSHNQSSFKTNITGQPASQLFYISYLLFLQEAIDRREETLMAASQDLSTKEAEDIGREVISSEGEGDSPACQSF